jgi:hypothetical protein
MVEERGEGCNLDVGLDINYGRIERVWINESGLRCNGLCERGSRLIHFLFVFELDK